MLKQQEQKVVAEKKLSQPISFSNQSGKARGVTIKERVTALREIEAENMGSCSYGGWGN